MQARTAPPPRRAALQACRAGVRGVGSAAALRASCCCAPLFPLRLGPDVGPTRSLGRVLLPWLSVLVVLTGSSVMPDFQTVLASVRDQLAFVDRRLAELDAQRGDLQSERGRLATAVAVMEEHARSSGSGVPQGPEEPPLAARILDAVGGSSGRTRADLLRVFGPLGVNQNTLDSAIARLVRRGALQRRGKHLFPSAESSPEASSASSPPIVPGGAAGGPQSGLVLSGTETVDRDVAGSATVAGPGAEAPSAGDSSALPKVAQVRQAVASLPRPTRAALVKFLGSRGLTPLAVDHALFGLRKQQQIERGPDGVYVIVGADDPGSGPDPLVGP